MDSGRFRTHFLMVAASVTKYFYLLLFPLIRGLIAIKFDFYTWISDAWYDIAIVSLLLIYAFTRWLFFRFEITENEYIVTKGLLLKYKCAIKYSDVSSVSISAPLLYRMFRAAKISIETDSGSAKKSDINLILSEKYTHELISQGELSGVRIVLTAKWYYTVLFALLSSDTFSGAVLLSAFISQAGNVLDRSLQDELLSEISGFSEKLQLGIPPIAVAGAIIVLLCWIVAFILNVIRYFCFNASRYDNLVLVKHGWITKSMSILNINKVNYIEKRSSLFSSLTGIVSLYVNCIGYGKGKHGTSVLYPYAKNRAAENVVKQLIPEFDMPIVKLKKPAKKDLRRFITAPIIITVIIPLLIAVMQYYYPAWSQLILLCGIMLMIPAVRFVLIRLYAYYYSGYGENETYINVRYNKGHFFYDTVIKKTSVSCIETRSNYFRQKGGCYDIVIYTLTEKGKKKHIVKNLNYY